VSNFGFTRAEGNLGASVGSGIENVRQFNEDLFTGPTTPEERTWKKLEPLLESAIDTISPIGIGTIVGKRAANVWENKKAMEALQNWKSGKWGKDKAAMARDTGYYVDRFGNLKTQIDDWAAEIQPRMQQDLSTYVKGNKPKAAQLSEYWRHPKLYENYPELATKATVKFKPLKGAMAQVDTKVGRDGKLEYSKLDIDWDRVKRYAKYEGISLNMAMREILVHEGQHIVQALEKHPGGSNPAYFSKIKRREEIAKWKQALKMVAPDSQRAKEIKAHLDFVENIKDVPDGTLYTHSLGEADAGWAQRMLMVKNVAKRAPVHETDVGRQWWNNRSEPFNPEWVSKQSREDVLSAGALPSAKYGMKKSRTNPLYHGTRHNDDVNEILQKGFTKGASSELEIPGTSVSRDPLVSFDLFGSRDIDNVLKVKADIDPKKIRNLSPSDYFSGQGPDELVYGKPQTTFHESELYGVRKQTPMSQEELSKITAQYNQLSDRISGLARQNSAIAKEARAIQDKDPASITRKRELLDKYTVINEAWERLLEKRDKIYDQMNSAQKIEALPPFKTERLNRAEQARIKKLDFIRRKTVTNTDNLYSKLKSRSRNWKSGLSSSDRVGYSSKNMRELNLNLFLSDEALADVAKQGEIRHLNKASRMPLTKDRVEARKELKDIFQGLENMKGANAFYERALTRGENSILGVMTSPEILPNLVFDAGYSLNDIKPVIEAFKDYSIKNTHFTTEASHYKMVSRGEQAYRAGELDDSYRAMKKARNKAIQEANKLFGVN